jgi:hypothetical protein
MPKKTEFTFSFDDLTTVFVWPGLLRSAYLALRPARLGLCLLLLVGVGLIGQVPNLWLEAEESPATAFAEAADGSAYAIRRGILDLSPAMVVNGVYRAVVEAPLAAIKRARWSTVLIAIPIFVVCGVLGGATSRLAAEEFSLGVRRSWTSGLGFALSRWFSLTTCVLAPVVLLALAWGGVAVVGWVFLGVPYLDVLGGAMYALALVVGGAGVAVALALVLGSAMLVPAIACEGSDAIDSIQRTLAYAFARPGRLVAYLVILALQLIIALWALSSIADLLRNATFEAATTLLNDETRALFRMGLEGKALPEETPWHIRATVRSVAFWHELPHLLVVAYAVSFWFSGGTTLYLSMRRVYDGQDVGDLWKPTMIPGTSPQPKKEDDDHE